MTDYQLTPEQQATLAKLKRDKALSVPSMGGQKMPKDKTDEPLRVIKP